MRLPLFVLQHLNQFPHPCFFWSEDILNSEKERIGSSQLLLRWEKFVWYSILPLNL
jgi:hypothetical protein